MNKADLEKRRTAKRHRTRAVNILRQSGLTDEDIAKELGVAIEKIAKIRAPRKEPEYLPALIPGRKYPTKGTQRSGIEDGPQIARNQGSKPTGRDWNAYTNPERRCTAHKQDGVQCSNAAILGSNVCRFHGGAAPQVVAKAKQRLQMASNRMVSNLFELADGADSEKVRLDATNSALDRAGISARTQIEIGLKPWEQIYDSISGGPGSRAESRARRGYEPAEPSEIIDRLDFDTNDPALIGGDGCGQDDDGDGAQSSETTTAWVDDYADRLAQARGYEALSSPEPVDMAGGHRKYRTQHVTGQDAIELASRLNYGEIERPPGYRRRQR